MRKLSEKTITVQNSGIRKLFNMTYGMDDIVSFSVGEPDFSAPQRVVDAANECQDLGKMKYTPNAGLLPLREKLTKWLLKNDCVYTPDQIIVTVGAMEALLLTMFTLLDPGDEVIIPDPCWCNYFEQIKLVGGVPVPIRMLEKDGFVYDPDTLRKAITPRTKAILLNTPSNPCGAVTSLAVQKEIAKVAVDYDLWVVTDEVYQKFVYDPDTPHHSIATLPGMKERTIIIDGFSKTYAMTGYRIGYAAGPEEFIKNMVKMHESTTSCVSASAQYGAMAALDGTEEEILEMKNKFDRRRQLMVNGLNAIDKISCIMPKGAFYAFPNITKTGMKSEEFVIRLLKATGVVLVHGTAFGASGEGFVRLSYATSEDNIREGLKRIETFVRENCK